MKAVKISIIIPTLNEEKYLEETLKSLLNQKHVPEYELVIADGGSTDNTIKIAKKYADLVVHEPKRTTAAGRQSGALASHGEILVSANADCIYPENWLVNIIKPLEKKKIAASLGKILPKDGDFIDNVFSNLFLNPTANLLSKINLHFAAGENMAIKRREFLKVRGFNSNLVCAEDTDLIKRIKKYGKIVYIPEAVVYVSMRRVRKWGKLYFVYFHTSNFIKMHFFNNAHAHYQPIRE